MIALILLGFLALNYPLLALFSKTVLWFGIPALFLYLFMFWALFIGMAAAVMERKEKPDSMTVLSDSREHN